MFQDFCKVMHESSALVQAEVPQGLHDILSIFAKRTIFKFSRSNNFFEYHSGSGAGTPIADLLFSFLIARVLRMIDSELADRSLLHRVDSRTNNPFGGSSSCSLSGASYIDDTFFATVNSDASICLSNSVLLAGIVIDIFHLHGLQINFKKGKTEFMCSLRGKDSICVYQQVAASGHIVVPNRVYGSSQILCCHRYKHVGSFAD